MNQMFKIVFLLLLSIPLVANHDVKSYHFDNIDITHGLSLNSVSTIVQDKYGFMWLGTEDGLDRYDGASFKTFRHNPLDSSSINSSSILSTLVDSRGDLWVGTYGTGLNKYVYETEKFVHYPLDPLDSLKLGDGSTYCILEDHHGYLWVGTSGAGLYRLEPETGRSIPVRELISNGIAITDTVINSVFEDHQHQLWISTLGGLNVLDLNTYSIRTYQNDSGNPHSLFDDNVTDIHESYDGENYHIWVGTNWGGFDRYDPEQDHFIHHGLDSEINPHFPETSISEIIQVNDNQMWLGTDSKGILIIDGQGKLTETIGRKVYDDTALNDDVVQDLYDDGDIIWVATGGGGVSKYVRNRKKFYSLTYDPLEPKGLHDNRILQIQPDSRGNLWIATWSQGLSKYNLENHSFTVYQYNPDDEATLSDNGIQDIWVDSNDNVWIASASTNLDLLRAGSSQFEHITPDYEDPDGLHTDYILTFYEDRAGLLWLGSWKDGLISLDPATMNFTSYQKPAVKGVSLGSVSYFSIFEDRKGLIWLGAESEGLLIFDRQQNSLKQHVAIPGDNSTLPINDIMCFLEDEAGYIWIGTYGGGLSKFDPLQNTFENYGLEEGLSNETIYAIFEDENHELWMSTNRGLAKFNKETKRFKNYGIPDGVLSREFNPAGCQLDNGWLYFGGVKGITYFNPAEIQDNQKVPQVYFTGLSIMNYPLQINEPYKDRVVLNRSMILNPEIHLYPDDFFFTINFASLDYYHSRSNEYSYQLVGFDDEWRYNGNKQDVTFTNLAPGSYTLRVKGSNNDGIWNDEPVSLNIVVHPEFYETWWFLMIIATILILVAITLSHMRTAFLRRRSEELTQYNIELNAQIESRREAHNRARERADYFRAVISQSPIPMAIHNTEGNITHLNKGWVKLWGADNAEDIIRDYRIDLDSLATQLNLAKSFRQALEGKIIERPEVKFIDQMGTVKTVQLLLYPLRSKSGGTNQIMVSVDDVTEIVKHRKLLEKSITEKDLLLKEVHHRVKNNLQVVASLLGLQKAGIQDEKTAQTLEDFRNRVNSMALVHDALYRSPELDNIDFVSYIEDLTYKLQTAFKQDSEPIQLTADVPDINISVDMAVPCGLMINELVTNAMKYAFPGPLNHDKKIIIRFTVLDEDHLRLEVIDNGVGFQRPVVWDSVDSLGLYLVKILSEQQLGGSVILKSDAGSHFIIEFPLNPNYDD